MRQDTTPTVIVCGGCGGRKGRFEVDRSWAEYTLDWVDCEDCGGVGHVQFKRGTEAEAQQKQAEAREHYTGYGSGTGRSKPPFYGVVGD